MSNNNNNNDYGTWLSESINELNIKQNELAKSVGCSPITIRRYCEEINKPNNEMKDKISAYLREKEKYKEYKHIPSKDFGKLLEKLMEDFKGELTETELAEKVGLKGGNSAISKIESNDKKITTELQYKILYQLLLSCYSLPSEPRFGFDPSQFHGKKYETAKKIYRKLFNNVDIFDYFEEYDKEDKLSLYSIKRELIDYFVTLSPDAQDLITSAPLAFIDSMKALWFAYDYHYVSAETFIVKFNDLPSIALSGNIIEDNPRMRFQHRLEELIMDRKILSYYDSENCWELFEMVTDYRYMMKNSRNRRLSDPSGARIAFGRPLNDFKPVYQDLHSDRIIDRDKQVKKFEEILHSFEDIIWDYEFNEETLKEFINTLKKDIDYRLKMSPWEWYMWMLYSSYVFMEQEDDAIYKIYNEIKIKDCSP